MNQWTQQWSYTVVQGFVTISLLVVAFLFRDNAHIPDLIVGAVISQWLREGVYVGQGLARGGAPTIQVPVEVPHISAAVHPTNGGNAATTQEGT